MQLLAWYKLQKLLREQWKPVFAAWEGPLHRIETQLHGHEKYLDEKFADKAEHIRKLKASGIEIIQCYDCRRRAAVHRMIVEGYRESRCLVCDDREYELDVICPHCDDEQELSGSISFTCGECGQDATFLELKLKFQPKPVHKHDDQYFAINCWQCDERDSVIGYKDRYVCLNCLHGVEEVSFCEYCNEGVNRPLTNSIFRGCGFCDGKDGPF